MFDILFEIIVYIVVGCALLGLILLNGFLLVCFFKGVRAEASWFPFRVFREEPNKDASNDEEQKVDINVTINMGKDKSAR